MKTKKATRKQTKLHNQRLVLKTIYDGGPISRADVARMTHLTRPTVSTVVAELLEAGLVSEVGHGPSVGGKPPILLAVVDDSRYLIGIDLAESEFRGAVIDLRGNIVHRVSLSIDSSDGEVALARVYELVDALLAVATSPLLGIGIGTPGLIDARNGVVRYAVNLDWLNLPLQNLLAERYHLPVYIANDSHAAALAEYVFGCHQTLSNIIVIKVGRGVGAGVVLNGRLYYGDGSGAGEIGHVRVVEQDSELCRCGHRGCLETVTSSRAIVRRARDIARDHPQSTLHQFAATPEAITIQSVVQAFAAGDAVLDQLVAETGRYLGIAVANLVGAFNIQQVLIVGSVACFGEPLLDAIRHNMHQRAMAALAENTHIGLSNLGEDIAIQGAAALLLTNELGLI